MNKFLTVAVMALGISGARAADLPARVYTKAPVAAPVYNWTGWYVGAQGGYSDGVGNQTIINGISFLNAPFGPTKINGGNYGGVIGYDYQFAPSWVIGINTEFNGGKIKGTFDNGIAQGFGPGGDDIYQSEVRWFGSTRAKLGYVFPSASQFLIYGQVGVAYADIHAANGDGLDGVTALNCSNNCASGSKTQVGYTVGAGVSWMIPNTHLILSGEYAYYDFGTARISTTDVFGAPNTFDVKTHFNTGRGVLSYKF